MYQSRNPEERVKLKRTIFFWSPAAAIVLVILFTFIFATQRVQVPAGHEGVLVDKPFWTIFGQGGVRPEPMVTGSKWLFYTTELIHYDVRPVQKSEAFDDAKDGTMSADNIPIDFNAYITVRPIPGKTPRLHEAFGPAWYEENLRQPFRTSVRDEVAKVAMTALTTRQVKDGKDVLGEIQRLVRNEMTAFVKQKGLPVEVMEVLIGKATPPQQTLTALAETASQQQRAQTEIERAAAEKNRENAERNRATADNAYRNSLGYSPSQFLQLEMARKQVEAVQACAGKGGCTVIIGELGGAQPALAVK